MRTLLTLVVCLVVGWSDPLAQGILPLSGTYRLGGINVGFAAACGFSNRPTITSDDGTLTFQPSGTWALSSTALDVCPGGITQTSLDTESGIYQVGNDGRVTMDSNPAVPGEDIGIAFLRSDASVVFVARQEDADSDTFLGVAVALSRQQSNASLNGTYGLVRHVQRNDTAALSLRTDYGTITFDGNGGSSESGTRQAVVWNGSGAAAAFGPVSGTYAVAPDGNFTRDGGGRGAISADGEFVYWVRQAGVEIELTMVVRLPAAPAFVAGDWRFGRTDVGIGAGALQRGGPELQSDWGTVTLTPQVASGGALAPTLLHIVSTPSTVNSTLNVATNGYTLGAAGALTLFAQSAPSVPGWVSRDGSVLIAAPTSIDSAGLVLGLARCAWPAPIGAGTPGLGGLAPMLFSIGGFPHVGNGTFGLVVAQGRGGASGVMLLSRAPLTSGFPFLGTTLWIDPTQIVATLPVLLSGPPSVPGAGAAGLPLALPADPFLGGARLAGQAVLLDAGASRGLSATAGLDISVCR